MKLRAAIVLFSLIVSGAGVYGKEIFLAVSGTANNVFFSDARIFNPNDRVITIQAFYLPRGNTSNSTEQAVSLTVSPRQMKVFDDIVKNALSRGDVGGIRFVSDDDFVVTQRVYALTTVNCGTSPINPCTLGQFVQGLNLTDALRKGVILQLKSGTKFRTNVGALNPNPVPATVTWRLYDKNSVLVSTGAPIVMPPYATIGPTGLTSSFFFSPGTADLEDAWVSFDSDQPIFAYGSVVDNASNDQTYVPASADSGTTPPLSQQKTVTISAVNWAFNLTGATGLNQGDSVKFLISAAEGTHGIRIFSPSGQTLIDVTPLGAGVVERVITLSDPGTYAFVCTRSSCGQGHGTMNGDFVVGTGGNPGSGYGY